MPPQMPSPTARRAAMPTLTDHGRILTPAIHLDFDRRAIREPGLTFEHGRHDGLSEIVAFLSRTYPEKQFAPHVRELSGLPGTGTTSLLTGDSRQPDCGLLRTMGPTPESAKTHIEKYSRGAGPSPSVLQPGRHAITASKRLSRPRIASALSLPLLCCHRAEQSCDLFVRCSAKFYRRFRTGAVALRNRRPA